MNTNLGPKLPKNGDLGPKNKKRAGYIPPYRLDLAQWKANFGPKLLKNGHLGPKIKTRAGYIPPYRLDLAQCGMK